MQGENRGDGSTTETARLARELDITNADHIALWIEANTIPDEPMNQCASWLACRIVEAHEATLTRTHPSVATGEIVERECRECNSTGVAEYIEHFARPCDACHGEGVQRFTATEAGLLDQCEQLSATIAEQKARIEALETALESCVQGFEKHARHWRESNKRTHLIEDEVRAENADALAFFARKLGSKGQ